MEMPLL
jgi:hypothetical protein